MDGCMNVGETGGPALPVYTTNILLPQGATFDGVHVAGTRSMVNTRDINLASMPIMPQQPMVPIGSGDAEFTVNQEAYDADEPVRDSRYRVVGVDHCRGYTILTLNVFPVEYVPASGMLHYHPRMVIDVSVEQTGETNRFYRNSPDDRAWVENLVLNPGMTDTYTVRSSRSYPGGICDPADSYDYVIITTTHNGLDGWATDSTTPYNWTSLMDKHQTENGLACTLMTMQDINAEPAYWNTTALFNDTAAHIREFCRDAYQDWGIQYVLIGGDDEWLPRRELHYGTGWTEEDVDSDLYWSNLDKTFNSDQDNEWGEYEGDLGFDLFSELFIGSLSCDEPQDVSNWMNKSFYYADAVDKDYLDNAAFYGGNTGWACQGDDFIDYSAIQGTDDWLGPSPHADGPYPSWLGFQYGFETWNTHNPAQQFNLSVKWTAEPPNPGWQGGSESAAINGLKNDISNDKVTLISGIAHADSDMSLDVYDSSWESDYHNTKPFFIHDYGCHCGEMDSADDGVLHSMLFHSDTELAFAAVYNTGYGWGNSDGTNSSSSLQQKSFWDYMFDTTNHSGSTINWQLGKAHAWTKDYMAPTINWTTSGSPQGWRGVIQCCLLFGDPAQRIKPPLQPDHEIIVNNLDIPGTVPHGQTQYVEANVVNAGKNNESNLQVNFTINGTVVDSTMIPLLQSMHTETVSFAWNPDNGTYLVGIEADVVPGENFTFNNHVNKTVQVIPVPDIWTSPPTLDFYVDTGDTDTALLTIGNEAHAEADLTFNTSISGGSSWLTVAPMSGTVSIGGSMDLDVSVDATGMTEGTYLDTVVISCNDLDEPAISIPVTLYVTYPNDVGVTHINTPSNPDWAGSTTVNATVFNYGSQDQAAVPVTCTIYEGILEYTEDFEIDDGGYTHSQGPGPGSIDDWEWGTPTSGPYSAHSGVNVWATHIAGDHSNSADSVLNSVSVDLSLYPLPELRFWHWADVTQYDCGNVKISTDGGSTWNILYPQGGYTGTATSGNQGIPGEPAFTANTAGWEEAIFDLDAYAGDTAIIRWHFGSTSGTTHPGWYLDDVTIRSGLAPLDTGDIIYSATETISVDSYMASYALFTPPWDAAVGNYTIQVGTQLPGDQDNSNNQTATTVQITEPPITTVDFQLSEGWNLISIPIENNYTAGTLGENISSCSIVSRWDAGTFESFVVGISSPSADFPVQNGVGYFAYVDNATEFNVTGQPITSVSVPLYQGWNIIGWYKGASTMASSLGGSIANCSIVSKWNAATGTFASYLVGVSPPAMDFPIVQGDGVFLYVDENGTWRGEG
jgi:hypothetical protein